VGLQAQSVQQSHGYNTLTVAVGATRVGLQAQSVQQSHGYNTLNGRTSMTKMRYGYIIFNILHHLGVMNSVQKLLLSSDKTEDYIRFYSLQWNPQNTDPFSLKTGRVSRSCAFSTKLRCLLMFKALQLTTRHLQALPWYSV
jgi:hypothetical protein